MHQGFISPEIRYLWRRYLELWWRRRIRPILCTHSRFKELVSEHSWLHWVDSAVSLLTTEEGQGSFTLDKMDMNSYATVCFLSPLLQWILRDIQSYTGHDFSASLFQAFAIFWSLQDPFRGLQCCKLYWKQESFWQPLFKIATSALTFCDLLTNQPPYTLLYR